MTDPTYRPGDIVDGHVLTTSGQWVPLAQPSHGHVQRVEALPTKAEDHTTRLFNLGRSRLIVFKGEDPKPKGEEVVEAVLITPV